MLSESERIVGRCVTSSSSAAADTDPGTFRPLGSNVIQMPSTAEAAVRLWWPLAARLAVQYATQYFRPDIREDLEQEGMIAIASAWESYEAGHECSWVGWATHRIKWAQLRWIDRELHPRRLHAVVMVQINDENVQRWVVADEIENIEHLIDMQIQSAEVRRAVECLAERQQNIVRMTFGMGAAETENDGMTTRAVGATLGVSASTVSSELRSAIHAIRRQLQTGQPSDEKGALGEEVTCPAQTGKE